jgi:glycerophosphoryl diester phosphodiesterase
MSGRSSSRFRIILYVVGLLVLSIPAWPSSTDRPFDVQGHRGCRGLFPENTMPAFRAALELGVTTLELDLQTTRDRVLVVHHDQKLNPSRCVRDDGSPIPSTAIMELDYSDLADIDCGRRPDRKFPEMQTVTEARIPRLEEVLTLARDAAYPVRLSIEIKLQRQAHAIPLDEFAELFVKTVREFGLEERTIVQSFRPEALRAVGELAPEIDRAILVRQSSAYDRAIADSGATILSPRFDGLQQADVERFRERGIAVIPWTVNKPNSIRRMIDWGVDGMISDYPDRVLEILSERDPQ